MALNYLKKDVDSNLYFNEDFVSELRLQYISELDNRKNLEKKANNIISISGTVAALLFGFGGFLIDKLHLNHSYLTAITIILLLSVLAVVISIIFCILATRIQEYWVVIDHKRLYNKEELNERFYTLLDLDKYRFGRKMASDYIACIKKNVESNELRAKYIAAAQIIFFSGIVLIPILLLIVFTHYSI